MTSRRWAKVENKDKAKAAYTKIVSGRSSTTVPGTLL